MSLFGKVEITLARCAFIKKGERPSFERCQVTGNGQEIIRANERYFFPGSTTGYATIKHLREDWLVYLINDPSPVTNIMYKAWRGRQPLRLRFRKQETLADAIEHFFYQNKELLHFNMAPGWTARKVAESIAKLITKE